MKKNVKKIWNEPTIVKLDVSKTAGGKQWQKYESPCNGHDSSKFGAKACPSSS